MFADLALARRLERTEGFAGAAFVAARGGRSRWLEVAGCYAMFDGADSPLTQTFGLGMLEPATPSVLTRVEDFFQANDAPAMHEICPLAGVPLLCALAERAYVPVEVSSVMFLERAAWRTFESGDLTVRVAGPADADAYCRAASQGWGETEQAVEAIAGLSQVMFRATGYTGFLVEKDGRTIATAGLVIRDGVALFAGASTLPSDRRLGAQRAVLAARFEYAAQAGCDLAMMVTDPGGVSQRNAERSGFRIAYTRTKWRRERNFS